MGTESIEASFLSIFALISFFIFFSLLVNFHINLETEPYLMKIFLNPKLS